MKNLIRNLSIVATFLSGTALGDENYQINYGDPSRTTKDIKYVYQISAQGSHTPS